MPVYMIVELKEVMDKEMYGDYCQKAAVIVKRSGGQYLARGPAKPVTGNWNPSKIVIIKFESMSQFQAWWDSPEYQSIVHLREQSAKTNAVVVEGL